jgi:hypothetical protein
VRRTRSKYNNGFLLPFYLAPISCVLIASFFIISLFLTLFTSYFIYFKNQLILEWNKTYTQWRRHLKINEGMGQRLGDCYKVKRKEWLRYLFKEIEEYL